MTSRRRASMISVQDQIRSAVMQWEGVVVLPHRFGGIEFRLGKRELGHISMATVWLISRFP